jgi:hypothetical protein
MNPTIKNIIGAILGLIAGGAINMGIIMLSGSIIPLPEGIDPANMESLKENMHLFAPRHFIFPFLAHALGTLSGAFLAAKIVSTHKMKFAIGIGIFFLAGGIANAFMLPAPYWFITVDLIAAYIPMGWIGGKLTANK